MTITRIIEGKTVDIVLTSAEMREAYRYWENKYDTEDMKNSWELMKDEPYPFADDSEEQTEAVALYRKYRSNDDDYMYDAVSAIRQILSEREETQ